MRRDKDVILEILLEQSAKRSSREGTKFLVNLARLMERDGFEPSEVPVLCKGPMIRSWQIVAAIVEASIRSDPAQAHRIADYLMAYYEPPNHALLQQEIREDYILGVPMGFVRAAIGLLCESSERTAEITDVPFWDALPHALGVIATSPQAKIEPDGKYRNEFSRGFSLYVHSDLGWHGIPIMVRTLAARREHITSGATKAADNAFLPDTLVHEIEFAAFKSMTFRARAQMLHEYHGKHGRAQPIESE